MATSTGKKARKKGGNRAACKRAKATNRRDRKFGKLAYSVAANNAQGAVLANEELAHKVRAARQKKTGDPEANVAVEV